MQRGYLLCLVSVLAFAGPAAGRRPLIRAPRDARTTGDHMIVLDRNLSPEDFRQLLARISQVSNGATVHSYVENVAKVITAPLSPYALEMVSIFPSRDCISAYHALSMQTSVVAAIKTAADPWINCIEIFPHQLITHMHKQNLCNN